MSELFRCIALLCAVSIIQGYTDVRDDASWFKAGERLKNKFVTGVVNGVVDTDCTDSLAGENIQGECMSKLDCIQSGGRPGGLCSLMGSCCYIKKTCGDTTSAKVSYFVSPGNWTSPCTLTVRKYSKDVCQIRLDFMKFEIHGPSPKGESLAHECQNDKFMVEKYFSRFKIPPLCGKNDGQHIYIHVGKPEEKFDIMFELARREDGNQDLEKFSWNIKITQLECGKHSSENFLSAQSKLTALHSSLKNKKRPHDQYDLIAPPGCFQYYRDDTGTFESFNYNEGNGPYIGNLHYAICLRKSYNITGAEYEAIKFQMNGNQLQNEVLVCHPEEEAQPDDNQTPGKSQDYIRIPEGWYTTDTTKKFKDHYCSNDMKQKKVTATANEPLYVGVHTDGFRHQSGNNFNRKENGFKIKYKLLTHFPK